VRAKGGGALGYEHPANWGGGSKGKQCAARELWAGPKRTGEVPVMRSTEGILVKEGIKKRTSEEEEGPAHKGMSESSRRAREGLGKKKKRPERDADQPRVLGEGNLGLR